MWLQLAEHYLYTSSTMDAFGLYYFFYYIILDYISLAQSNK